MTTQQEKIQNSTNIRITLKTAANLRAISTILRIRGKMFTKIAVMEHLTTQYLQHLQSQTQEESQ